MSYNPWAIPRRSGENPRKNIDPRKSNNPRKGNKPREVIFWKEPEGSRKTSKKGDEKGESDEEEEKGRREKKRKREEEEKRPWDGRDRERTPSPETDDGSDPSERSKRNKTNSAHSGSGRSYSGRKDSSKTHSVITISSTTLSSSGTHGKTEDIFEDDEDDDINNGGDEDDSDDDKSTESTSTAGKIKRFLARPPKDVAEKELGIKGPLSEEEARLLVDVYVELVLKDTGSSQDASHAVKKALQKKSKRPNPTENLMSHTARSIVDRLDWKRIIRCAEFFGFREVDLCQRDFQTDLGGLFKIELRSHQLYAIFFLLESEILRSQSSFICDGPGAGKTYQAFALMVIARKLTENRVEVAKSRHRTEHNRNRAGDKVHLKEGDSGKCPSGSGCFFQCACEKGSLASKYIPRRGINVLLTQAAVVPKMLRDFQNLVPAQHNFVLYTDLASRCSNIEGVETWNSEAMSIWSPNVQKGQHRIACDRVVVIMAHNNFKKKYIDLLKDFPILPSEPEDVTSDSEEDTTPDPKKKPLWPLFLGKDDRKHTMFMNKYQKNNLGRIVADECHLYHTESHSTLKWLLNRPHGFNDLRIYPQTGTPLGNDGLSNMRNWVIIYGKYNGLLEMPSPSAARGNYRAHLKKTDDRYKNAVKDRNNTELVQSMQSLQQVMNFCNMIRRTEATLWLDKKPVIICPSTVSKDIHCALNDKEHIEDYHKLRNRAFRQLKEDAKKKQNLNLALFRNRTKKMMVSATWPGLIKDFLSDVPKYSGNALEDDNEEYTADAIEFAKTSPKFQAFIEQMKKWGRKEKIAKGERLKVLIYCENPFTIDMWGRALRDKYGSNSTEMFTSRTSTKERERIIAMFDNDNSKIARLSRIDREKRGVLQFFCSTYGVASTGIDLRAAYKVVLLEPSHHHKNEEQAICRAARMGQDRAVEVIRYTSTDEEKALRDNNGTVERLKDLITSWGSQVAT